MSLFFIFLLSIGFSNCASKSYQSTPNSLSLMTYNVENLFDSKDDPGKDDETYLPRASKNKASHRAKCHLAGKKYWVQQCLEMDWTDRKVQRKLRRLADVILQIKAGKGPDILILQEVENRNIAERLRKNHLQAAGYNSTLLIEGPDKRGIDVAILSRLPQLGKPQLHKVILTRTNPKTKKEEVARSTRGILQARFQLPDKKSLTVFGVHFPSQGSPTKARQQAIQVLNQALLALSKDELAVAAGDFNITTAEEGRESLFTQDLAKHWLISHRIGCDPCEGTHNYRGKWSFLDAILFSKNFKDSDWVINKKSIRVANKSRYQVNPFGGPARFKEGLGQRGVSDHFPLTADIQPKESKK